MLVLLVAAGAVTVGEVCASIVVVAGAAKLLLETVECATRIKKALADQQAAATQRAEPRP